MSLIDGQYSPNYLLLISQFSNKEQADSAIEMPVLAYTQEVPVLREEYDNYALVQFIPLSMWENIAEKIGNAEADTYIRVLAKDGVDLTEANELEASIAEFVSKEYAAESENRLREKVTNDNMLDGYMFIIGAFCALLAGIGIANVFSNTLGFLYQRKREFAQYMSIGMTPADIRLPVLRKQKADVSQESYEFYFYSGISGPRRKWKYKPRK